MTLTVDGRLADASGSILDAVLALGIDLPHLCKDDHLPAIGACRTCLVEADGRIVASCWHPAAAVSEVLTQSERAKALRATVLELTLGMQLDEGTTGGPHAGSTAETAAYAGVGQVFPPESGSHVDTSNPFFAFHEAACILCGRCTTACQSLQHISAIGLAGHGRETRVTAGADVSFLDSVCTSCGSCVAACPTTALRPKGVL